MKDKEESVRTPLSVVVIKTDQQRADTIAAQGNPHMITPNMDRLVREGISYTNAHCCGATCVASRAAFYTGQEQEEYFNMATDPWEEHNLAADPAYRQEILEIKAEMLEWLTVSRYLGSLPQINDPCGKRGIWPANHAHDPYVLSTGSKKPCPEADEKK
jgi:arylsulfatase A-like enzyme